MLLLANSFENHVVIGIDNHLKCVHDKLQKIFYVFGHVDDAKDNSYLDGLPHKEDPKVCESLFHSLLEAYLEGSRWIIDLRNDALVVELRLFLDPRFAQNLNVHKRHPMSVGHHEGFHCEVGLDSCGHLGGILGGMQGKNV
jgi:hypothetical protein